jgi:transposase InsO family protein
MKGATMLATLEKLGIVPSFSRARVSNDNAYAESLFRICKYLPNHSSMYISNNVHIKQCTYQTMYISNTFNTNVFDMHKKTQAISAGCGGGGGGINCVTIGSS